ncbi:MAG: CapA family protein [Lachnospiraceae bacterium]|nr:CapA family protein [Lachnospiraceae bacterium]
MYTNTVKLLNFEKGGVYGAILLIPAVIAYYQRYAAKFAIDAGADIIIGHHEHILKPIEVYKGKVIIYGMANFGLEGPEKFFEGKGDLRDSKSHQDIAALNPDMAKKKRTMPEDSYKSMAIKCIIEDKKINEVYYLPVKLSDDNIPRFVKHDDPEFAEIVDYMTAITKDQKIEPHFTVVGDEVRIV